MHLSERCASVQENSSRAFDIAKVKEPRCKRIARHPSLLIAVKRPFNVGAEDNSAKLTGLMDDIELTRAVGRLPGYSTDD